MGRILYAWEIGGGLGHFTNMLPTACRLQAAGHQVHVAVRHLNHAEQFLGKAGLAYGQAPVWLGEANAPSPANYAEILLGCGYADRDGLIGLMRAWRQCFMAHQPDLLVADHAPTALLAARGLGIRTALIGHGFFSPPRISPMPIFRNWEAVDGRRVAGNEQHVVNTVNAALSTLKAPSITALSDIFTSLDADLLCTWPELDAYPQREPATYYGPIFSQDQGCEPTWQVQSGKRILLYLKARYPHLPALLQGLRGSQLSGAAFIAGTIPQALRQAWPINIQLLAEPIHLRKALAKSDVIVSHAGATAAAALLAGKPSLLLPMQAEQFVTAQRVSKIGAAITLVPELKPVNWTHTLHDIVHVQSFTDNAKTFAAKYAEFDSEKQADAMTEQLLALL